MLAYVHPGHVSHDFLGSVLEVLAGQKHQMLLAGEQSGVLISRARNHLTQMFLDSDAEYLWFIDTDISFVPETLDRLIEADLPIVSALYYGKDKRGSAFPVGNIRSGNKFNRVPAARLKGKKPAEVDGVGMGCCLIKREVLESLGVRPLWPFAEILYEGEPMGEDITFCVRAAERGYKSFILPTARVGHLKEVLF